MGRVKQQPELGRRGAVDHARHQRPSTTHGVSQARTRRSVTGQATTPTGMLALLRGVSPRAAPGGAA
jgi:hypothetical protein